MPLKPKSFAKPIESSIFAHVYLRTKISNLQTYEVKINEAKRCWDKMISPDRKGLRLAGATWEELPRSRTTFQSPDDPDERICWNASSPEIINNWLEFLLQ